MIDPSAIRHLTEESLNQLIAANRFEDGMIDFKVDWPNNESFGNDVAAFANTRGGYLIIGARDKNGKYDSMPGVDRADFERKANGLESSLKSKVYPPVISEFKRVPLANGNDAAVVAVGRSQFGPHVHRETLRYKRRGAAGNQDMTPEEIRDMTSQTKSPEQQFMDDHEERAKKYLKSVQPQGVVILDIAPLPLLKERWNPGNPSARSEVQQVMLSTHMAGHSFRMVFDGHKSNSILVTRSGGFQITYFENFGSWGTNGRQVDGPQFVRRILEALAAVSGWIGKTSPGDPIIAQLSLVRWKDVRLMHSHSQEPFNTDCATLPPVLIPSGTTWLQIVPQLADWSERIWQAFDIGACFIFDDKGQLTNDGKRALGLA